MGIYKIIKDAALVTAAWMVFGFNLHLFVHDRSPRANVCPSKMMKINGHAVEVPAPDNDTMKNADLNLSFTTPKAFRHEMQEY